MNRRNFLGQAGVSLALAFTGRNEANVEKQQQLQLWLTDQFYADLPPDRYTDEKLVEVDWAMAKEWVDGPLAGKYVAQCKVRPTRGDWELLAMKRVAT